MIFKLILIVSTLQGLSSEHVITYNLTREQCIIAMLKHNEAFKTDKFECQGNETTFSEVH